jgi:hypothetical protein
MWTIYRSADLPLCGEGATVERSDGKRAPHESAESLARKGKAFVSAATGPQLRVRAACGTPSTNKGTLSTHRGYSEYSQGVLRVLTGGTLSTHTGTLSAHRGYSEYSHGCSECSQGYSEYSQGYSECSQGVL